MKKNIELGMVWNKDWHRFEVTKVFKNGKVQITETWIAEDSGKDCKSVENYNVGEDEYGQFVWQDKYKEYAFNEKEEDGYCWWARMYAAGADNWNGCEEEVEEITKEEENMKEAQVQVTQIEVDGVVYTMTRPGYYYKKEEGKQVRVSKAEWEQAFDAYMATAEAEEPIEEPKKAKAKKVRKSKDIAFEYKGHTLTAKQVKFIQRMPEDDFYEHGLDSALWIDVYCDTIADEFNPMAVGAMVSTLREKDIIAVSVDKVEGKKCKHFTFTPLGKEIAKELGLE